MVELVAREEEGEILEAVDRLGPAPDVREAGGAWIAHHRGVDEVPSDPRPPRIADGGLQRTPSAPREATNRSFERMQVLPPGAESPAGGRGRAAPRRRPAPRRPRRRPGAPAPPGRTRPPARIANVAVATATPRATPASAPSSTSITASSPIVVIVIANARPARPSSRPSSQASGTCTTSAATASNGSPRARPATKSERERDRERDRGDHPRREVDDEPAELVAASRPVLRAEHRRGERLAGEREHARSGGDEREREPRRRDDVPGGPLGRRARSRVSGTDETSASDDAVTATSGGAIRYA